MSVVVQKSQTRAKADQEWVPVHRVVFPTDGDTEIVPLYVDFNAAHRVVVEDSDAHLGTAQQSLSGAGSRPRMDYIEGRRQLRLPAFRQVSFGTYFNAFPASYWKAHTAVSQVRLNVRVDAPATIAIFRSTARGTTNRVDSVEVSPGGEVNVDLPLSNFGDGGWYWFDLSAGQEGTRLLEAYWSVPKPDGYTPGTATVAVTTFNRPDYCVKHLKTFAQSPELFDAVDRLIITDQGTNKVRDQEGFAGLAEELGERFSLIEQGNLGGSGGFARGMYETVERGESDYVLLLDDDVLMETEGILRAINFADFTRTPTLVGGHMFNLYERSVMHTYGEAVDEYKFFWHPLLTTHEAHDFAANNLRVSPWMHRRADVDFNGWWMCLIPVSIIKEIGLSLPVFIKWDDAEFGLRAKKHGYSTVSLPGAAVWHLPWTEKDDTIDWQAYFHQRNRWVAALIYSPYRRGGDFPRLSFLTDIKHLLSMQYSAVALRLQGLEDVLRGPEHLHPGIRTKLPEIRARRAQFDDAQLRKELTDFPKPRRIKPPRKGKRPTAPNNLFQGVKIALKGALRQIHGTRPEAQDHPETLVPAMDARWWRLSQLDSALVTSADGSGFSWYKRQPEEFRAMLLRSIKLHQELLRRWDELSEQYSRELSHVTSPAAWKETFDAVTSAKGDA